MSAAVAALLDETTEDRHRRVAAATAAVHHGVTIDRRRRVAAATAEAHLVAAAALRAVMTAGHLRADIILRLLPTGVDLAVSTPDLLPTRAATTNGRRCLSATPCRPRAWRDMRRARAR